MPFKSESQRRYLWAKHPELARRWADEYPNQKKLPKHVGDKEQETSKTAAEWIARLCPNYLTNKKDLNVYQFSEHSEKAGNSKQEYIQLPQTHGPSYAGEEPKLEGANQGEIAGASREQGQLDDFTAKSLFHKLAIVIAPKLLQEVEDENAKREGRPSSRMPQNLNIKRFSPASPSILPPMGMAPQAPATQPQQPQQAAQAQPQAQPNPNTMAAVGAGSSPQANPIQSFGGLSSSGDLNGNASFGTKNAPGGLKTAGEDPLRLAGTGVASLIGGLGVGSYPGWKLQQMSERAGNHPFVNFVAGKAPIAMSSALSAGLFNYLYDLKSQPKKPAKKQPEYTAPESLSYLKYLVH